MKTLFCILFSISSIAVKAQSNIDTSKIYTKPEVEAEYVGGKDAWAKFLNHTLRYPDDAINNEIRGEVMVQFVVNTDSTISDVHAISGPTKGGLRDESVRVVKLSGKWNPAIQNRVAVRSYKKIPIKFMLSKG
ncbi:MAG: energy transducer TonB [Bacteroidetes bacterium]|nr:energy transducer TonB [Bacteroidota bacterium]